MESVWLCSKTQNILDNLDVLKDQWFESTTLCSLSQETCRSGCILPNSLSIRVLWARQGLLDLPQSYILGAKYLFQCQNVKVGTSDILHLLFHL